MLTTLAKLARSSDVPDCIEESLDPTTLATLARSGDVLACIVESLDPRHTCNLRLLSRDFRAGITPAAIEKNKQAAVKRYRHVVQLPNGAFRINYLYGTYFVDVKAEPVALFLFADVQHSNPMLSVRINGREVSYIGRIWVGFEDQRPWPNAEDYTRTGQKDQAKVFRPDSTILLKKMDGVWVTRVRHNVDFFYGSGNCTVVHLAFDKGGAVYKMQLVCMGV
jgi:hypothetical protein